MCDTTSMVDPQNGIFRSDPFVIPKWTYNTFSKKIHFLEPPKWTHKILFKTKFMVAIGTHNVLRETKMLGL